MVAVPASREAPQDHDRTGDRRPTPGCSESMADPEPSRARGCLYPGVPTLGSACPEGIDRKGPDERRDTGRRGGRRRDVRSAEEMEV